MPAICPECDNPLSIDTEEDEDGDTVTCDECGTDLEIVTVEPLHLVVVDGEGYDDEDESFRHDSDDESEE